jgi:hypothetical protein
MKIGSVIQKLIGGGGYTDTQTYIEQGDLKSLLLFFQNMVSNLITCLATVTRLSPNLIIFSFKGVILRSINNGM